MDVSPVLCQVSGALGPVYAVAHHPDGTMLATGSDDGTIRIWDIHTGNHIRTSREHTGPVRALAYSPDGRWLVAASAVVHIRRAADGELVATLIALNDGGYAVLGRSLRYKLHGTPTGEFFYSIGLCRFEPGELDPYVPELVHLTLDAPILPDE